MERRLEEMEENGLTCIVGLIEDSKVYIGGDSAGIAGYDLVIRADEKVFKNGEFIMGFTSSFRMGQLLRYKFKPPFHMPDVSIDEYMVTTFIDEVRECLKNGGFTRINSNEEIGGSFLVGYRGQLFEINVDFQVGKPLCNYASVGCGSQVALGSLYSTNHLKMTPHERVILALEAAESFSAGVRRPFKILDRSCGICT